MAGGKNNLNRLSPAAVSQSSDLIRVCLEERVKKKRRREEKKRAKKMKKKHNVPAPSNSSRNKVNLVKTTPSIHSTSTTN